jgi:hypothetical protein
MKTNKALKRLAKIEALISDMTKRYSSAPGIRRTLQEARSAVTRAKAGVSLQASSEKAKNSLQKAAAKAQSTAARKAAPARKK